MTQGGLAAISELTELEKERKMEKGYIRYDYDPEHENKEIHPLYHLDVNYSSGVTYKIGLNGALQIGGLKKILDTTTDCAYLTVKS